MKKLTRKNPNDIYSLWLDLSSKDKSKARKAALALKSQLSSKKSLSDFWPIIREERDLTVSEIKAKIESVIKKTSGARVNPVRKATKKSSNPTENRIRLYEIARKFNKSHDEIIKIAKSLGIYVFSATTAVDDADAWLIEESLTKTSKKRNPQTISIKSGKKPKRKNSISDQIWEGRNDPNVISWRTKHVTATNIFADWRRYSMFNGKKSFKDFVLSHEDVNKLGELPDSEDGIMNSMLKMAKSSG